MWVKEVERFDITPETILIGHSSGAGFWLRYLSEHKELKVGKVILVAPSLGYGWDGDYFFEGFTIDPNLTSRTKGMIIFNSDNDNESIQKAVAQIRETLPAIEYREFHLKHFTFGSMGTDKFPELLAEALK